METTENQTIKEKTTPEATKQVPSPVNVRVLIVPLTILAGLVLLFVILYIFRTFINKTIPQALLPSPIPVTQPQQTGISRFGQTPEFIQFEKDVLQLKTDFESVDLAESKLTFPLIDWEVNYQK